MLPKSRERGSGGCRPRDAPEVSGARERGSSTSSEIPEEEQKEMGLSDGLIRFSIGLDNDIKRTYQMMRECMVEVGIL